MHTPTAVAQLKGQTGFRRAFAAVQSIFWLGGGSGRSGWKLGGCRQLQQSNSSSRGLAWHSMTFKDLKAFFSGAQFENRIERTGGLVNGQKLHGEFTHKGERSQSGVLTLLHHTHVHAVGSRWMRSAQRRLAWPRMTRTKTEFFRCPNSGSSGSKISAVKVCTWAHRWTFPVNQRTAEFSQLARIVVLKQVFKPNCICVVSS